MAFHVISLRFGQLGSRVGIEINGKTFFLFLFFLNQITATSKQIQFLSLL